MMKSRTSDEHKRNNARDGILCYIEQDAELPSAADSQTVLETRNTFLTDCSVPVIIDALTSGDNHQLD